MQLDPNQTADEPEESRPARDTAEGAVPPDGVPASRQSRQVSAGDFVGGDQIAVGDIEGSYIAIGNGAQVLVQQAISRAQSLDEERQLAERILARSIEQMARRYVGLVAPGAFEIAGAGEPRQPARFNPYKPLQEYEIEDSPRFFGRDEAIRTLLGLIGTNRLTILHAESGAGKTSLLQAGLASRLLAAGHLPLRIRPYNAAPSLKVKRAFLPDLDSEPVAPLATLSLRGFLIQVCEVLGDRVLCLFLDQFEEFFVELPPKAQKNFAAELAECLDDPGLRVRWLLSLRKEYFSDLNVFRPYIANPYANHYFLETFGVEDGRIVVEEPARSQGVTYEDGLVSTILRDLDPKQTGIAPTQIQLVCSALFEKRTGDLITRSLYLSLDGAAGLLKRHLETVLADNIDTQLRSKALAVLDALVTSDSRRLRRNEASLRAALAGQSISGGELGVILDELIHSRLVRVSEDEQGATFELAHDYLAERIELSPEGRARKAAQELLERELVNWRQYRDLMGPRTLQVVSAQRDVIVTDSEARQLLVASAFQHDVDLSAWLAYVTQAEARQALLASLDAPEPHLRQRAAIHLAGFFDEAVAGRLAAAARIDPAPTVRQAALATLSQGKPALARSVLLELLAGDTPEQRRLAAFELRHHLDEESVAGLFRRVLEDEETAVWQAAISTLTTDLAEPFRQQWQPLHRLKPGRLAGVYHYLTSLGISLPWSLRLRAAPPRAFAYARHEVQTRPSWTAIRVFLIIALYGGLAFWRGWYPFLRWEAVAAVPQAGLTVVEVGPDGLYVGSFDHGVGLLGFDGSWSDWRNRGLPRGAPGDFDDPDSDVRAINDLALNPLVTEQLFAYIVGSGVWRSNNDGIDWKQLAAGEVPANAVRMSLDAHGSEVLIAMPSGLFASPDGGSTWQALHGQGDLPGEDFQFVRFSPTGTPFVGTADGIYQGLDAFPWRWQRLAGVPATRYIAYDSRGERLYLALGWPTALAAACYDPAEGRGELASFGDSPVTALSPHPEDADIYFVATSDGYVYEVTCGGADRRSLGRVAGLTVITTDLAVTVLGGETEVYQSNTAGFYRRRP